MTGIVERYCRINLWKKHTTKKKRFNLRGDTMINFILFVTVVVFWLGAVYLYFVLSNMLEDIREINKDIIECKAMMQRKIEQDNIKAEIPNDEFLGI